MHNRKLGLKYLIISHILGLIFSFIVGLGIVILVRFLLRDLNLNLDVTSTIILKIGIGFLISTVGYHKVPLNHFGVVTIFDSRLDNIFLSEGTWWVFPKVMKVQHIDRGLKVFKLDIDNIYFRSTFQEANISLNLNWSIIDPIKYVDNFQNNSMDPIQNIVQNCVHEFIGRNSSLNEINITESSVDLKDHLQMALINNRILIDGFGVIVSDVTIRTTTGNRRVMNFYQELYFNSLKQVQRFQNGQIDQRLLNLEFEGIFSNTNIPKEDKIKVFLALKNKYSVNRSESGYDIKLNNEIVEVLTEFISKLM